jgi:hypothetical protein
MTAIAQWGKSDPELACMLPGVERALVLEAEAADTAAAEAEAADADAKEAEAAAADDEDAMDDVTASANVVSAKRWSIRRQDAWTRQHLRTAVNVAWGTSVPSNDLSERVITQ